MARPVGRVGSETEGDGWKHEWAECSAVRPGPEKGAELGNDVQEPMLELAELRGGLRRRTSEEHGRGDCSRIRPGCERGVELEEEEGSVSTRTVLSQISGATQLYASVSVGGSTQLYSDVSAGESTQQYPDTASEAGTGSQGSLPCDA